MRGIILILLLVLQGCFAVDPQDGLAAKKTSSETTTVLPPPPPQFSVSLEVVSLNPGTDTAPLLRIIGLSPSTPVTVYSDGRCQNSLVSIITPSNGTAPLIELNTPNPIFYFYIQFIKPGGGLSECAVWPTFYVYEDNPKVIIGNPIPSIASSGPVNYSITFDAVDSVNLTVSDVVLNKSGSANATVSVAGGTTTNPTVTLSGITGNGGLSISIGPNIGQKTIANNTFKNLPEGPSAVVNIDNIFPTNLSGANLTSSVPTNGSDSNIHNPTLTFSNISNEEGSTISIYDNNSCLSQVGSKVISNSSAIVDNINYQVDGTDDGTKTFYGKITDDAGNSSACINLGFSYNLDKVINTPSGVALFNPISSPGNVLNPTINVSGVSLNDTVFLYKDSACTEFLASAKATSGSTIGIVSSNLSDGSYTFYARAQDDAANLSDCSTANASYTLDTASTSAAMNLSWAEANPHNGITVNATWLVSVSADLTTQKVQYYKDGFCESTLGAAVDLGSSVASTVPLNGSLETTYSFKIISIDSSGNTSDSACSPYMTLSNRPLPRLSVGDGHVCFKLANNNVKCWGDNSVGELGSGDNVSKGDNLGEMGTSLGILNPGTGVTVQGLFLGKNHSCGLFSNKELKCWGGNNVGQLGLGDLLNRPVTPNNLLKISVGNNRAAIKISNSNANHTCAILDNGSLKCWGLNSFGQLGLGDVTLRGSEPLFSGLFLLPIALGTNRTVHQVATGEGHTCAILDNGELKCWGNGDKGQLGSSDINLLGNGPGEMGDALDPIPLGTSKTAKFISLGASHTCVILNDDSVKCWGLNDKGQLGQGNTSNLGDGAGEMGNALTAVSLGTSRTAIKIASGNHFNCALLDNNTVKCWGDNSFGQLGLGNTLHSGDGAGEMGDALLIVQLGTGRTATDIAAGGNSVCALLDNETVKCWGENSKGQLGIGNTMPIGDVSSELNDNLLIADLEGKLANSVSWQEISPHDSTVVNATWDLPPYSNFSNQSIQFYNDGICGTAGLNLVLGNTTTTVLNFNGTNGTTYTFRHFSIDGAGMSFPSGCSSPMVIDTTEPLDASSIGWVESTPTSSLSVTANWAVSTSPDISNQKIQFYIDTSCTVASGSLIDLASKTKSTYSFIAPGNGFYSYEITSIDNADNENVSSCSSSLQIDTSLHGISIVAPAKLSHSAGGHSCALKTDSNIVCWGSGTLGQLGNGANTSSETVAVLVSKDNLNPGENFARVSSGQSHSCALTDSDRVFCWGDNVAGQLGLGSSGGNQNKPVLTDTTLISGTVTKVFAVDNGSCVTTGTGNTYCWGSGNAGRLGYSGPTSNTNRPQVLLDTQNILPGNTEFTHISGGNNNFMCGLTTGNIPYCWGLGTSGQLGRGSNTNSNIPVAVDMTNVTGSTFDSIQSGSEHSCGLKGDDLFCWGKSGNGQLGITPLPAGDILLPTSSNLASNVVSFFPGLLSTCYINSTDQVKCFGRGDDFGSTGNVTITLFSLELSSLALIGGEKIIKIFPANSWGAGLTNYGNIFYMKASTNPQKLTTVP